MGRLSGFGYRDIARRLRHFGFEFQRSGKGSHEIWLNLKSGKIVPVPHHAGDMPEGTLRSILRQAGIDVEEFLKA